MEAHFPGNGRLRLLRLARVGNIPHPPQRRHRRLLPRPRNLGRRRCWRHSNPRSLHPETQRKPPRQQTTPHSAPTNSNRGNHRCRCRHDHRHPARWIKGLERALRCLASRHAGVLHLPQRTSWTTVSKTVLRTILSPRYEAAIVSASRDAPNGCVTKSLLSAFENNRGDAEKVAISPAKSCFNRICKRNGARSGPTPQKPNGKPANRISLSTTSAAAPTTSLRAPCLTSQPRHKPTRLVHLAGTAIGPIAEQRGQKRRISHALEDMGLKFGHDRVGVVAGHPLLEQANQQLVTFNHSLPSPVITPGTPAYELCVRLIGEILRT